MSSIAELTARVRAFARERDWEQFHTPKNLAMALAGEVGELLAELQWLTPEQAATVMRDEELGPRVAEHVRMSGHGVTPAERHSWSMSLFVLAQDLADAGLDDVEVLVEYQQPLTSRRVDAILAGIHPRTGEDSFVVVELKQWSYATRYEDSETLVDVAHPRRSRAASSRNSAAASSSTTCAPARSVPLWR